MPRGGSCCGHRRASGTPRKAAEPHAPSRRSDLANLPRGAVWSGGFSVRPGVGRSSDSRACRPRRVPTVHRFPVREDQCSSWRSFSITAAGQSRSCRDGAPGSLLSPAHDARDTKHAHTIATRSRGRQLAARRGHRCAVSDGSATGSGPREISPPDLAARSCPLGCGGARWSSASWQEPLNPEAICHISMLVLAARPRREVARPAEKGTRCKAGTAPQR